MNPNSFHIIWIVVGVTILIFWRVIRRESLRLRAKDRFAKRLCTSCGYDLRASDDSCPECGFPIQAPDLPLAMPLHVETMKKKWPEAPVQPRKPRPDECLVEVYESENAMAVDVLSQQFEARGIPSEISESNTQRL